ncbi:hypothetical protein K1719_046043 [Acacia pycnantha]|nr:hypothetical protein K1719_046043 [Acacia pycnantha]
MGLLVLSMLWPSVLLMAGYVSSELHNKTCNSPCGNIPNISYPFRLPHDPPYCGLPDYELACENNVTFLHLNGTYGVVATYRVVRINYHNLRIKLIDPGIQAGNLSSLPLYSLSLFNFNNFSSSYDYYEQTYSTVNNTSTQSLVFKQVAYLNCSDPVRNDTAYVDTAPWVKRRGHLYAVAGDLLAPRFQPHCLLEFVTPVASDWESLVSDRIKSYADIHSLLSFGFELSWWRQACGNYSCPDDTQCVLSPENRSPLCFRGWMDCRSPLGINHKSCGHLTGLRIFAEDFLVGIWKGLSRIENIPIRDHTYYDYGPSKLLIKLGVSTGRFVLPFITILKIL